MPTFVNADVVVVGAGPAGIAAGTRAAEAGATVAIVDAGTHPGGQIWRHADPATLPHAARRWIERSHRAGVRWLLASTVIDGSLANGLVVVSGRATHIIRAPRVVIATGARELFLPYPGWTLPNAMGVGGAQALLKGGIEVQGKHVILAGSGPLLLPVAAAFSRAGARVKLVMEQVPLMTLMQFGAALVSQPQKLIRAVRYRAAIPLRSYRTGMWVTRADGDERIESVTVTDGRHSWSESCDLLACSYGLVPSTELAQLLGCEVQAGAVVVDGLQQTTVAGILCAGESTGVAGDDAAIAEGEIAGLVAVGGSNAEIPLQLLGRRDLGRRFQNALSDAFRPRAELLTLADPKTLICRCEDVRFEQLEHGWTGRQAKLYTRIGMGPCQGAVCGPVVQHLFGWTAGSVRPPLFAPALDAWTAVESPQVPNGRVSGPT